MTMRYSKSPSNRQLKISEELKKQISQLILRGDIYHPIFEGIMISITDVRISPDLRIATVFFTYISKKEINVSEALNAFASDIRRILARRMKLRFMPELRFVYDKSIENSVKIEKLLSE